MYKNNIKHKKIIHKFMFDSLKTTSIKMLRKLLTRLIKRTID